MLVTLLPVFFFSLPRRLPLPVCESQSEEKKRTDVVVTRGKTGDAASLEKRRKNKRKQTDGEDSPCERECGKKRKEKNTSQSSVGAHVRLLEVGVNQVKVCVFPHLSAASGFYPFAADTNSITVERRELLAESTVTLGNTKTGSKASWRMDRRS